MRLRLVGRGYPGPPNRRASHRDHDPSRYKERGLVWLDLNKIGVWWCDWEVLEVVVEGAVGDVGGEGREGVLRGERARGLAMLALAASRMCSVGPRVGGVGGGM